MRHASPILAKSGTPVTPAGKPAPFRAEGSVHTMAENTPGDMSEAHFLTIAEVAAKMRVSKMTVYRLVHGGELPAVRVGRSFRVREDDVNEYLRKSFYNAG
jgi:excisionase family DNA binding protein